MEEYKKILNQTNPIFFNMIFFCVIVITLMFSIDLSAQTTRNIDYDKYYPRIYTPKKYLPPKYIPKETLILKPYSLKKVEPNVFELNRFIYKTEEEHPELINMYKGDWNAYKELRDRYITGDVTKIIGKKNKMKYFQEDWELLDKVLYEDKKNASERSIKDSLSAREQYVADSLLFRKRFVSDSLQTRDSFLKDSINARRKFVDDSLYRADYKKRNNFDYVQFDGPHGKPQLCYRGGKIIEGKTYNKSGLVEKEYKGGKLIHDYQYRDEFLEHWTYDRIERKKTIYDGQHNIEEIKYYSIDGLVTKKIGYKEGKPSYEVVDISYFPDKKTIKSEKTIYDDCVVFFEYYSDGSERERKRFRKIHGKLVLNFITKWKDGYHITEYYDYDGKFEKRTIESDYNSYNPYLYYLY